MPQYNHILLPDRKAFGTRLVYFDASLPLEQAFRNSKSNQFDPLLFDLYNAIAGEREALDLNDVQLDSFLKLIIGKIKSISEIKLGGHKILKQSFFNALDQGVKAVDCNVCLQKGSLSAKAPCNGTRQDDSVVTEGGLCIAPIQSMFELAVTATKLYYAKFGSQQYTSVLPEIRFSTAAFNGKPHDVPVDYFVGGQAGYEDTGKARVTRVTLRLPVKNYDLESYLATPYVLFHECIAHALRGIYPSSAKRIECDADNRFEEGWMDLIAYRVLSEILENNGPFANLSEAFLYPISFLRNASVFHNARMFVNRRPIQPVSEYAIQRAGGAWAAQKVLNIISSRADLCLKQGFSPWQAFLRMSFDLNMMSDFDTDKAEHFIGVINLLGESERLNLKKLSRKRLDIAGIISDYLEDYDANRLINSMLQF